jgi:RNA polymerase sigma factor (sigma-70 family)
MTEDEQEFAALMQRIREGSPEAMGELIDRYGTPLLKAIRRRLNRWLRRQYDSEDFLQAVWTSFWTDPMMPNFDSAQALVAYLNQMARHKVLDEVRRRRVGRSAVANAQSLTPADSSFGSLDVPAREPTPSYTVANRELLEKLREELPESERLIIDLVQHGLTQEEIARQIGVSPRTVSRVVRRVRRVLNQIAAGPLP